MNIEGCTFGVFRWYRKLRGGVWYRCVIPYGGGYYLSMW